MLDNHFHLLALSQLNRVEQAQMTIFVNRADRSSHLAHSLLL